MTQSNEKALGGAAASAVVLGRLGPGTVIDNLNGSYTVNFEIQRHRMAQSSHANHAHICVRLCHFLMGTIWNS